MTDALALEVAESRKPSLLSGKTELSALLNWLAGWVMMPLLPFLPVTLMGGPPRFFDIAVTGLVGLFARRFPFWVQLPVFAITMTYLVLSFIGRMFNMHISLVMEVAPLVLDLNPANSKEYIVGAVMLLLTCGAAVWLLRQGNNFKTSASALVAVLTVITLTAGDFVISREARGAYSRLAPADAPFDSASSQTNLLALADGKTNIMVVVVEAMGQPRDAALQARFNKIWQRPELAAKYEISHGDTQFYGSTTSGEMRELCERWGDYGELKTPQPNCLPAILAKRGYRTSSYHAYHSAFFERERWYPLIGIQNMTFYDEMMARGLHYCPSVFSGPCDSDVPSLIARDFAKNKGPQFAYWLTLNSHLPIVENDALKTKHCHSLGAKLDADFPMICRLFSIWDNTANSLAKVVSKPDFPPTDILIVGDHMPPFTHQASRLEFDNQKVPWILLKYKGADKADTPR
ncbi:MAG: sulfatase-like hydrolase/transferase [Novosphingobium sp.]|nr:sulfatase-like hydrolase/transferase [Novosphingobium sp.]